jgi:hypothetical protein
MPVQLSLFDDASALADLLPRVRRALNFDLGEDEAGRKKLVDHVNALSRRADVRLTSGNTQAVSKDTLDKWVSPGDKSHPPSVNAIVALCLAMDKYTAVKAIANACGLDVITREESDLLELGRICREKEELRMRERQVKGRFR